MKTKKLIIALLSALVFLTICAFGVAAETNDDGTWGLYVKDREVTITSGSQLDTSKGYSIAVAKGGVLNLYGEVTDRFDRLVIDEGGTVIITGGSQIDFDGVVYIAGTLIINEKTELDDDGAEHTRVMFARDAVVDKTGVVDIYGKLVSFDTVMKNNGTINVKNGGNLNLTESRILNYGTVNKEDGGRIGNKKGIVDMNGKGERAGFLGSVFAGGNAGGYVLAGVGAFVLGAAVMLVITRVRSKKGEAKGDSKAE